MKREKYNLSHTRKTSMKLGYLTPIACFEVIPGDIIRMTNSLLVRTTPLLRPLMHLLQIKVHTFFVSYRNLWTHGDSDEKGFEDFITGGKNGNDGQVFPTINLGTVTKGSLHDHLGIPTGAWGGAFDVNALYFRAYNDIHNNFYRDADLQDEQDIDLGEGPDTTTNTSLLNVCWGKDAFTTARPWQQRGTNVTIPLGDDAPITGLGVMSAAPSSSSSTTRETDGGSPTSYTNYWNSGSQAIHVEEDPNNSGYPNVRADLSQMTGIDIEDLRTALGIQRFQERLARGGSRYADYLRGIGCILPDYRLMQPDYLGGGRQVISFSEVLATDGANTGTMYGHGIGAMQTRPFTRYFNEFGCILSLCSVVPKAEYMDSLHRSWFRETRYDFFQRELQLIGEQEVLNKEVQMSHSSPDGTFGYRPRYDSLRWLPSTIHGDFRDDELAFHMARDLSTGDIALNSSFVSCSPTDRVWASTSLDPLKVQISNNIYAARPLIKHPRYRVM